MLFEQARGVAAALIIFSDLNKLHVVFDVFLVLKAGPHVNVELLIQELLHFVEVLALKRAQRLPCDFRVAQFLPLDKEEGLAGEGAELQDFFLARVLEARWLHCVLVDPLQIVPLDVNRLARVFL